MKKILFFFLFLLKNNIFSNIHDLGFFINNDYNRIEGKIFVYLGQDIYKNRIELNDKFYATFKTYPNLKLLFKNGKNCFCIIKNEKGELTGFVHFEVVKATDKYEKSILYLKARRGNPLLIFYIFKLYNFKNWRIRINIDSNLNIEFYKKLGFEKFDSINSYLQYNFIANYQNIYNLISKMSIELQECEIKIKNFEAECGKNVDIMFDFNNENRKYLETKIENLKNDIIKCDFFLNKIFLIFNYDTFIHIQHKNNKEKYEKLCKWLNNLVYEPNIEKNMNLDDCIYFITENNQKHHLFFLEY
ncbi:hypothetical protein GF322_05200 [Candidatus Dependentiae bacterium]|nr:hypothetical protein [Candidatus Dependentiae bacterium]